MDAERSPAGGGGDHEHRGGRPGSRAARASASHARRARRSRYVWGGGLAAVLVVATGAGILLSQGHPQHSGTVSDGLVTTYLPGEYTSVPDACSAVTPATLQRYVPGKRRVVVPRSLDGKAQSLCDWSVDAPPMYRLLEVTVQAYAPSALASGDGSATFAATDAYRQALAQKVNPAKATHLPKASVTSLPGLGNEAFAALQVPTAGGDTTDLVTVVARKSNVLVTVVFDGLAHARRGNYGPVSAAQLQAGAAAAAREVLARF